MLSFKLRPLGARLIPNRISITAKVFSLKTVESSKMSEVNGHGRPVVELFVKAALDKMRSGGCPICHRYFMIFYILREKGLIDLIVTTFLPENPPKEILEFSNGKHYPLVKVTSGVDRYNKSLAGVECDTVDEIETLVDRFDCEELRSTKESRVEAVAEQVFDSLYTRFNQFLRSERDETTLLLKALEKVESYLSESGAKYLVGDTLHKADCYLLPTLQHIRVAGKAYRNFEIPSDFEYIWTYLKNAYNSDAFSESCPADREIVSHYSNKVLAEQKLPDGKISLMGDERTFSIPLAVGGRNSN